MSCSSSIRPQGLFFPGMHQDISTQTPTHVLPGTMGHVSGLCVFKIHKGEGRQLCPSRVPHYPVPGLPRVRARFAWSE